MESTLANESSFSTESRGVAEEDAENGEMIPGFSAASVRSVPEAEREHIPEGIAQRSGFEPAEIAEWTAFSARPPCLCVSPSNMFSPV
jgi:hypothetical protein